MIGWSRFNGGRGLVCRRDGSGFTALSTGGWIFVCIKIRVDLLSTQGFGFTESGFGESGFSSRMG